ncbi:MAG: glycosyltransferase, partial [Planctomycetaceae bacterium]|nr:glycosyltransferase [Planctomycetaceae bacterium]
RVARYDSNPRVSMLGLFRLAKTAIFSFSTFPLRTFHVIGAVAATVFLTLGGYALFSRLFTGQAIPGWTSQVLTGSFFGALNALGISILGEYVIRIYDQVRARPQYVVDRTVNIATHAMRDMSSNDTADDAAYDDLLQEAEQLLAASTEPATSVSETSAVGWGEVANS